MSEQMSAAHQDNFLMLVCYDAEVAPLIAAVIDEGLFTTQVYRDIASTALLFLDSFREPIGDHLADEFAEVLEGDDKPKARMYRDVLLNMRELKEEGVNVEYCLRHLRAWVNQQRFKVALTEAADMLLNGNYSEARERVEKFQSMSDGVFDGGTEIATDPAAFLDDIPHPELIGIPQFDRIGMGPEPGTVLTFVAPTGRGKTWFLVHAGKLMSMTRHRVLHVSLEMSESRIKRRYVQAFLAISKREATTNVARFITNDKTGRAESIDLREIRTPTLVDNDVRENIEESMKRIAKSVRIRVKQFPTSSVSIKDIEAFMDQEERLSGRQFGALALDYLDLLAIDAANLRVETGQAMKDFRRLVGERNLMGITASQTNRSGEDTKLVTMKHLAEDYSKGHTSDRVITFNQTNAERRLGLARLFAAKNRDDESGYLVVISQAYGIGQFVLDSTLVPTEYDVLVDAKAGAQDD